MEINKDLLKSHLRSVDELEYEENELRRQELHEILAEIILVPAIDRKKKFTLSNGRTVEMAGVIEDGEKILVDGWLVYALHFPDPLFTVEYLGPVKEKASST